MGGHRRFLINPEQINDGIAVLNGDTARQISKVLRLRQGDCICLLDGLGGIHDAEITNLSKSQITARILSTDVCRTEASFRLTLAVCLPKSDKAELIVQKCTELGISRLVMVQSERTISRLDERAQSDRMERWRRIAAEAAEQCGRGILPELAGIIKFADLANEIGNHSLALVAWEEEDYKTLRDVLQCKRGVESAVLIIGPEGGLTANEVECARTAGAVSVSLGRRVLRTETAAIAAVSAIMYELEGEL